VSLLDDFKRFVADAEAGTQYAKWAHDNPGELARWQTFRDALLAGERPDPPTMLTPHGRELVDAGLVYLDATAATLKVTIAGTPEEGNVLTAEVDPV